MTMTETQGAVVVDEASQQAFYVRIDQLYRMYEDWTGQTEQDVDADDGGGAAAPGDKKQSNGKACISPVEALTTLVMFSARLAVDFEMDKDDFIDSISTLYDNELAEGEEEDEAGAEGRAEPS